MAKIFQTVQNLVNAGFLQTSGQTLSLSGHTLVGDSATFRYATNQHSRYTARSVVDASYVTGLTANISHIGSNEQIIFRDISGITGATNFTYNKVLSGVTVPNLIISVTPITDTGVTWVLTWDSSTGQVKKAPYSSGGTTGGTSYTFSNGLTKTGNVVRWGGDLTTGTSINTCGNCMYITGLPANMTGTCVVYIDSIGKLSIGVISGGTGGSAVTGATNLGSGNGTIYTSISNCNIQLKTLSGGTNITISCDANYIAINSIASSFAWSGNTVNGIGTYIDSGHICSQSGLTFNGTTLGVDGDICASSCVCSALICGTSCITSPKFVENSVCLENKYLATGATAVCATCAGDSACLGGQLPSYYASSANVITGATNGLTKTGNTVCLGGTLINSTVITDSRVTTKGIEYGGNYSSGFSNCSLVTKEYVQSVISSGGTYNLQSPAAICVGGICVGTVLTGKTAFQLFQDLLVPELCGTVTAPSIGIALGSCGVSGLYEIGCTISETVTATFNRGCINPKYCSVCDKRSGLPISYCFCGCGMPSGYQTCTALSASETNVSYTIISGAQSWGVRTCYDAGCPALGSKGTQYCAALPANSTGAVIATITGAYPLFGTTVTIGVLTKQTLCIMGTSPVQLNVVTEGGGNKQQFEIPCAWLGAPTNKPLLGVCQYNTVSAQWEYPGGSQATSLALWNCSASSETIQGNSIDYCQYTYNGVDRAAVCIRLVF